MSKSAGWIMVFFGFAIILLPNLSRLFIFRGSWAEFFRQPFIGSMFAISGMIFVIGGFILVAIKQDKLSEKRMESIDRQFPCPVCKKDVFTWSKVPSAMIRLRVGLGQPTWARVCNNCGNVQQFTKTD